MNYVWGYLGILFIKMITAATAALISSITSSECSTRWSAASIFYKLGISRYERYNYIHGQNGRKILWILLNSIWYNK